MMAEQEVGDQERVRARASPAMAGGRKIVLIVDDHRDCADSLQVLLSTFGYEVHVAYEGYAAMRMLEATPFSVVLLDLSMPGIDGFEVARCLRRSISPCPEIIAISGWADATTKKKAREAGIDCYLVKPVEIEELRERLEASSGAFDGAA